MNQNQKDLVERLEQASKTRLKRASNIIQDVPEPLKWFSELYEKIELHCADSQVDLGRNAWQIGPVASWAYLDVFQAVYHGSSEDNLLQLRSTRVLANSAFDGSEVVALDVSAENFGKIIFCSYNLIVDGGGMPIVARSFEEWLDRTLDAGPEAPCPYWEMPEFQDLGPAIPQDPFYEPS